MNDPSVRLQFKTEDLWTYFDDLCHQNKIPSFGELFDTAVALWVNYSNPSVFTMFSTGRQPDTSIVPIGEPWRKEEDVDPEPAPGQAADDGTEDEGGEQPGEDEGGGESKGKCTVLVGGEEFQGDHVLARSASFMYEALVSKEVAQAVAEGDVGRVYEGIKVRFGSIAALICLQYTADDAGHVRRIIAHQVYQLPARHDQLLGV